MTSTHEMIKSNSPQQNYDVFSSCKYFGKNEKTFASTKF
jgi:hypothetical protein